MIDVTELQLAVARLEAVASEHHRETMRRLSTIEAKQDITNGRVNDHDTSIALLKKTDTNDRDLRHAIYAGAILLVGAFGVAAPLIFRG